MSVNVICLKWGTLYPAEYVNRLYRGVKAHLHRPFRFVCITDDPTGLVEGVEAAPFPDCPSGMVFNDQYTGWPNIYVKLVLYKPGLANLKGPTLFLDIDQIIMGDLDCFFDYKIGEFCVIHNWVERRKYLFREPPFCGNTSCFRFEAGGKMDYVYEKFLAELPTALDYNIYCTEQNYMTHAVGRENINFWPDYFVRSFKRSCTWFWPLNHFLRPHLPPADTRILCFHGNPSPEEAIAGYHKGKPERWLRPSPWVAKLWQAVVMVMVTLTMAMSASATVVKWEFPREGSCHEGLAFSDGMTGVLVWGGGDTIKVTIGRGDLWDHRGGYEWKDCQSYTNITALAKLGDKGPLLDLFKKVTPKGEPRNPLLLPFGRVVVTAQGMNLKRGELDTSTGLGALEFEHEGELKRAELAMSRKSGFVMRFPAGVDFSVVSIPSMEQRIRAGFTEIGHRQPEKWAAKDGSEGGFLWTLPNPLDKPASIAWAKEGRELAIVTARGKQRARVKVSYEQAKNESIARWKSFWDEGASINVPDLEIQEIFDYGMYRFGSMTDPEGYPAGLQGQWLEDDRAIPWNGDYHFNINVQECYSPAFRGGHFRNLMPLFKMILSWRERLRDNARKFVRIDNGYCLPHSVDDHGVTIGGFWTGTIDHASTAWMASYMYRYVKYSGDVEFLKRDAFDFMKGAMNVYLAMMVEHKGKLSFPVMPSPEWAGSNPKDAVGRDPSFQLAAAHRLARDLIAAASWLGVESDPRWEAVESRLPAYTQGPGGIQIFEGQPLTRSHRHHSHLAGLYPFDTIANADGSNPPIIAQSYRTWVVEGRGEWTGWCLPWAAILHTRVGNSEAAVTTLRDWKKFFNNPGHGSLHDSWNEGYTMYTTRKWIMQMDGQCAAATAILEMMAHEIGGNVTYFFRGCPDSWKRVSFRNLRLSDGTKVSGERINGITTINKERE